MNVSEHWLMYHADGRATVIRSAKTAEGWRKRRRKITGPWVSARHLAGAVSDALIAASTALAEASAELDVQGCQVAASDAHRASKAAYEAAHQRGAVDLSERGGLPERVWIDARNDDLWMDYTAASANPAARLVEYVRANTVGAVDLTPETAAVAATLVDLMKRSLPPHISEAQQGEAYVALRRIATRTPCDA